MSFDEGLAERVRQLLTDTDAVTEKKMFGGLAFMIRGNMCCGVAGEDLMVRVGPDQYEYALSLQHGREMDFTGRPMKGMVFVSPEGLESDQDLEQWVVLGKRFVETLPSK